MEQALDMVVRRHTPCAIVGPAWGLCPMHVGCTAADLRYVHEFHPDFAALPTFVCASALPATSLLPLQDILPNYDEVLSHMFGHGPTDSTSFCAWHPGDDSRGERWQILTQRQCWVS